MKDGIGEGSTREDHTQKGQEFKQKIFKCLSKHPPMNGNWID
jgi:hypothetical protein